MLTPRSELGLALIDGYLYAVGGTNGEIRLNTIERYSIADNKWTLVCLKFNKYLVILLTNYLDCNDANRHDKSSLLFT